MILNSNNEAITGFVNNFSFGPYKQVGGVSSTRVMYHRNIVPDHEQNLSEQSRDIRHSGARGCRIILNPIDRRICKSDNEEFRLDFLYYLQLARRVPPEVFDKEDITGATGGICDMNEEDDHLGFSKKFDGEKRFHRKRDSIILTESMSGANSPIAETTSNISGNISIAEPQTMLLRHLSLQSEPFVHNVSEQELKIVVSWSQYMINTVPAALSSLDLNVSRITVTAEEVRKRLERREFLSYLDKIFRRFDVTQGEVIPHDVLKDIFRMFLFPLHLLTSEERDQIRDLMFVFDRNLDGHITQDEFAQVGLELFVKSGWNDQGDISLKVCAVLASLLHFFK